VVIRPVASLFFGNAVAFRGKMVRVCRGGREGGREGEGEGRKYEVEDEEEEEEEEESSSSSSSSEEEEEDDDCYDGEEEEEEGRGGHATVDDEEQGKKEKKKKKKKKKKGNREKHHLHHHPHRNHDHHHTHPSKRSKQRVHHVLIDASAIRVLDLTALGVLADVVEEAGASGVIVLVTNTSHALKQSLVACELADKLGGALLTMATEEVYAKLVLAMNELKGNERREGGKEGGEVLTRLPTREEIFRQEVGGKTATMHKRLNAALSPARGVVSFVRKDSSV